MYYFLEEATDPSHTSGACISFHGLVRVMVDCYKSGLFSIHRMIRVNGELRNRVSASPYRDVARSVQLRLPTFSPESKATPEKIVRLLLPEIPGLRRRFPDIAVRTCAELPATTKYAEERILHFSFHFSLDS